MISRFWLSWGNQKFVRDPLAVLEMGTRTLFGFTAVGYLTHYTEVFVVGIRTVFFCVWTGV